jgi:hypothetical protein
MVAFLRKLVSLRPDATIANSGVVAHGTPTAGIGEVRIVIKPP